MTIAVIGRAKPGTPAASSPQRRRHFAAAGSLPRTFGRRRVRQRAAMTTTIEDVFGVTHDGARVSAEQPAHRLFVPAPRTADGLPPDRQPGATRQTAASSMAPALVFDRATGQLVGRSVRPADRRSSVTWPRRWWRARLESRRTAGDLAAELRLAQRPDRARARPVRAFDGRGASKHADTMCARSTWRAACRASSEFACRMVRSGLGRWGGSAP